MIYLPVSIVYLLQLVDPNTDIGTLATKTRTISPLVKSPNTEIKLQYIDTDPKTYAYPLTYDTGTYKQMYQDLPDDVLVTLAYMAKKSNFFKYNETIVHGDVLVINLKTLYNTTVYDNETGLVKTYDGMLGELLVSIDENITAQSI